MLLPYYFYGATPILTGFNIALTQALQVALNGAPSGSLSGLTTAAALGDCASSGIVLDDDDATLGNASDGLLGLHRMYFIEDAAPALDQIVWNGYIGQREYRRGEAQGIAALGVSRSVTVDLQDDNAVLSFRVIRTSDGNRPQETADTRLLWLLGGIVRSEWRKWRAKQRAARRP